MLDSHTQPSGAQKETLPVEFTFENQTVRTITRDGEIWFVATDVCKALEIQNPSQAVDRLDDDEKGLCKTETLGGEQSLLSVNEFGLYNLILRSNKAEAKRFKRWVTHDVLPSIRKTGRYEAAHQEPLPEQERPYRKTQVPLPDPGDYTLSVNSNGEYLLSQAQYDPIEHKCRKLNLTILSHATLLIDNLWLKHRLLLPVLSRTEMDELSIAIAHASQLANGFLRFPDKHL